LLELNRSTRQIERNRQTLGQGRLGSEAELLGGALYPHASFAARGKMSYAVSDRWKVIVGFDLFDGTTPSFFQNLHRASTAFVEVQLGL